ncbi:MAG: cell wall hydrolase [Bacillota bacterium]|nr:cell wall hydrolase [Bacillota bacterium]
MRILIATFTLLLSFLFATHALAYTVKKGDTLTKISSESSLTLQQLEELNPQIRNLNLIYVGQAVNTEEPQKTVRVQETVISSEKVSYSDEEIDQLDRLIIAEAQTKELEEVHSPSQNCKVADTTEKTKQTVITPEKERLSDYEIDLLARLVRAEAQTEPFEGKIAVACVVLNRVENPKFPHTIKGVIYAPGQFQPVSNGEINKTADSESVAAVKAALTEKRHIASGSLFFYNPTIARSHWLASRTTTLVIGQHVFKK